MNGELLPMRAIAWAAGSLLVCSLAAAQNLSPMVKVIDRGGALRGSECADISGPAIPRLEVEAARPLEMPDSAAAAGASATTIGSLLRRVQQAALSTNREVFASRLAEARQVAGRLAPGQQERAVSDALRLYGDLDRVWTYSEVSPTGAFFDDQTQSGSLLAALRAYPGYEGYIRPRTVDGHYYPTRETRDFLSALASSRLQAVGGAPPSVTVRETRVERRPTASAISHESGRTTPREAGGMVTSRPAVPQDQATGRSVRRQSIGASLGTRPPPRSRMLEPAAMARPRFGEQPPARSVETHGGNTAAAVSGVPATIPAFATAPPAAIPAVPPETAATTTTEAPITSETVTTLPGTTTTVAAAMPRSAPSSAQPGTTRRLVIPLLMTLVGVVLLIVLIRASR